MARSLPTMSLILGSFFVPSAAPAAEPPGKLLPEFIAQEYRVRAIAVSSTGDRLAVAGGQLANPFFKKTAAGELAVWDLKTRKKSKSFVGHNSFIYHCSAEIPGKTAVSRNPTRVCRATSGEKLVASQLGTQT